MTTGDDRAYLRRQLGKARPFDAEEGVRLKVRSDEGESHWVAISSDEYERVVDLLAGPPVRWTRENPRQAFRTDNAGTTWHFVYWGSLAVCIRERIDGEPVPALSMNRDDWPYVITLDSWGILPGDVTPGWFGRRVRDWIEGRNEDIARGNV